MTFLSRVGRPGWLAVMPLALALACGSDGGDDKVDGPMNTPDMGQVVSDAAPNDAAADVAAADGPGSDRPGNDGGACDPPAITSYPHPGCGASAQRVCSTTQVLDACAAIILYCGCDGKTTVMGGCGWSSEPFLYMGRCNLDGGTDGP
jgi:hypothetical protein